MGVGEGGASLSVSITGDLKLLVTTASPPSFLRGGGWISRNISGSCRGTASVMTWGEVEGGWKESWVIRADPKLGSLPHASGQPAPGCCWGRASHHCQPLAKPRSLACQESLPSSHLLSTCSQLRNHRGFRWTRTLWGLQTPPLLPQRQLRRCPGPERAVQQAELTHTCTCTGPLRCQSRRTAVRGGGRAKIESNRPGGSAPQDRPVRQRSGVLSLSPTSTPTAHRQTRQGGSGGQLSTRDTSAEPSARAHAPGLTRRPGPHSPPLGRGASSRCLSVPCSVPGGEVPWEGQPLSA